MQNIYFVEDMTASGDVVAIRILNFKEEEITGQKKFQLTCYFKLPKMTEKRLKTYSGSRKISKSRPLSTTCACKNKGVGLNTT